MRLRTDWRFNKSITVLDLEEVLPKNLTIRLIKSTRNDLTILDDFHWRIWQAGLLLTREDKNDLLQLWQTDESCLAACSTAKESRFWWQLPKGELADKCKKIVSVRAFVPKYACRLTTEYLAILNRDEKIVTRIKLFTVSGEDDRDISLATIFPLRGYAGEYSRIVKELSVLKPLEVRELNLRRLLLESGLQVAVPATGSTFNLEAAEPAETAVTRMAEEMIQSARHFEQGMIDDIDTEFVHQYRVHIRKTRSLISLFNKTLSPQRYQRLKTELKALGSQTNDLRDLDVFLLNKDYYCNMLPENLRPGLNRIFNRVKRRRTTALKRVIDSLTGDAYQAQISQLLLTLQQNPEFATKQSGLKIKPLVCKKVLAQYQRICATGTAIIDDTPDDAVHNLRIEGKKLRYLLELFRELFPKKKINRLIMLLKKLQDNLGRFNDYSVQRNFLVSFCQGKNISAEQLASINGLAAVLFNKQLHERSLVVENIAGFTGESVRENFQQLFANASREGSNG